MNEVLLKGFVDGVNKKQVKNYSVTEFTLIMGNKKGYKTYIQCEAWREMGINNQATAIIKGELKSFCRIDKNGEKVWSLGVSVFSYYQITLGVIFHREENEEKKEMTQQKFPMEQGEIKADEITSDDVPF